VRHQAGRGKAETTRAAYQAYAIGAEVSEFVDDMAAAYRWADLVICRAGALTIAELMAAGRAAVLVPYPFAVDDHQTVNARFLTDQGAAHLLPQNELTTERLAAVLSRLLGDRAELHTLAQAARRLARPDATRRVADVCEQVIA
jgi:UDP-N-acetylglucosamine--N-acetylmuramyl-(pentapeptide) pyrophosphoryl-undecaprenol N-acetylglucosamine transferase